MSHVTEYAVYEANVTTSRDSNVSSVNLRFVSGTEGLTFDELVREGAAVPVEGWDFSWLEGRATEERPSWGYAKMAAAKLWNMHSVLDVQTGNGEVFASVLARLTRVPSIVAATESRPANVALARERLGAYGVAVEEVDDGAEMPYKDESFDFVMSRHPTVVNWEEIARVLRAGGTYFSQQVGPGTNRELTEALMGPQPISQTRSPDLALLKARAAGLEIFDLRRESLRVEFRDIGAIVCFLRTVIWTVPDFSVEKYRDRLEQLHHEIAANGPFVSYAKRYLFEVWKPE